MRMPHRRVKQLEMSAAEVDQEGFSRPTIGKDAPTRVQTSLPPSDRYTHRKQGRVREKCCTIRRHPRGLVMVFRSSKKKNQKKRGSNEFLSSPGWEGK